MMADELTRARQAHQQRMKLWAGWLFVLALVLGVVAFILGVPARQAVVANGADPNVWAFPALFAGVLVIAAMACAYYAQPVPNEPLHAPAPFEIDTDQRWRRPTELRMLERLKKDLVATEKRVNDCHERGLTAYRDSQQAVSYAAYQRAKSDLEENEEQKRRLLRKVPEMQERIDRLAAGDVGHEMLTIEEQIAKLNRQKQENQRKLSDLDKPCTLDHDAEQCKRDRQRQRGWLHEENHAIDVKIIECETDLKELRNFDFQKLWRDLALPGPAELGRVPQATIDSLRQNVESVNAIPNLKDRRPAPVAVKPSPKDRRAQILAEVAELQAERDQALAAIRDPKIQQPVKNSYEEKIQNKLREL
jgi:hypothetical protein